MALSEKEIETVRMIVSEFLMPSVKSLINKELNKIKAVEEQVSKQQIEIENLRQLIGSKLLKKLMEG